MNKRVLKRDGVDDGCEHSHVIRTDAIHIRSLSAAPDVSRADHNGNLHARVNAAFDLRGDLCGKIKVQNPVCSCGKRLARQLEQYPAVFRLHIHKSSSFFRCPIPLYFTTNRAVCKHLFCK